MVSHGSSVAAPVAFRHRPPDGLDQNYPGTLGKQRQFWQEDGRFGAQLVHITRFFARRAQILPRLLLPFQKHYSPANCAVATGCAAPACVFKGETGAAHAMSRTRIAVERFQYENVGPVALGKQNKRNSRTI